MRWGSALALAVFILLVAWDIWEALGNLVGLAPYYEALGIASATPWWLLIAGVLIPVVGGGLGVVLTVKTQSIGVVLVGLLVIVSTQAALAMSILSAEQAWRAHHITALVSGG